MASTEVKAIVFSSTAAVYGYPEYLPMDEDHPTEPINFYGYTKLAIEQYLKWYGQLKGIKFAALRYFNAAGYDGDSRVLGLEKNPANLLPIVMEVASEQNRGLNCLATIIRHLMAPVSGITFTSPIWLQHIC
jgi:UDP-glucose 4-epimerase